MGIHEENVSFFLEYLVKSDKVGIIQPAVPFQSYFHGTIRTNQLQSTCRPHCSPAHMVRRI